MPVLGARVVRDEVGEPPVGLLHVDDKAQPVAGQAQRDGRAALLMDLQGEDGGTCRIVDAGDALEPALLGRDELQVRLGARAQRAGVDMDIGYALPITHEGPGEAVHMPQNARDGLVVRPWGDADRHMCWGRAAWASAPVSSLARLVMARAGGHPPSG